MNAADTDLSSVVRGSAVSRIPSWSRQRWFWAVLLVFLLQLAFVWRFSATGQMELRPIVEPLAFELQEQPDGDTLEWMELHDPTLFALINPRGFSGAAWLTLAPFPYRLTNEVDKMRWVAPDTARFGRSPTAAAAASQLAVVPTEKALPELLQPEVRREPLVARPSLKIEGELAGWVLVNTNSLPSADPQVVLSPFAVRVTVSADGDVLSATPAVPSASSGSTRVDEEALHYARSARFVPPVESPTPVTFGTLVFQWFASRLPQTTEQGK